ncbi:MAG: acyl-CoA dehydrogenase family protein [Thermoleophilia bacterium]
MSYYHPNFDVRKKFCECFLPEPREEVYAVVENMHNMVDEVIMPLRRDLDGGWNHDQAVADVAIATAMQAIYDSGWPLAILPEEKGGLGGVMKSMVTYAMLIEELGRADCGIALDVSLLYWFYSPMLYAGRMDLVDIFGAPLLDGKHHRACTSLTEPAGGTNIDDTTQHGRTIRTIARREGDEWVINGAKIWPSGASVADIGYMTLTTTDPNLGDEGIRLIYVPADAKGLSFGKPIPTMGMCCTDTNTEVFYDDVRVPVEYAATWGTDVKDIDLFKELAVEDKLTTPAYVNGACQTVLEILLEFSKDRIIAGKPMREHSVFVHTIGGLIHMWDYSRASYMQGCYMADHPEKYGPLWGKFMYSRAASVDQTCLMAARRIIETAMDLMGSYGTAHEYHLEKYYRDVKQAELWLGGRYRTQMDVVLDYYDYEWAGPKWEPTPAR